MELEHTDRPDAKDPPESADGANASQPRALAKTFETSKSSNERPLELENRTMYTLSIRARTGRLLLPPLGSDRADAGTLDPDDLDAATAASIVASTDPDEPPELTPGFIGVPLGIAVFCALMASSEQYETAERIGWMAGGALCVVLAAAAALAVFKKLGSAASVLVSLPRRMRELLYLGAVGLIVVAAPGAILYFGSDVPELLDLASSDRQRMVALIGIGVQFVSIVGASALPVLLYFVFDREKLKTLREKFVRHVFRLDPAVRTRTDVDVKYGQLLDEAYGRRAEERLLPGARSPILLATGVMTLGWTLALLDTNAGGHDPGASLTALLTPRPTASTYAFLGAYFFTLNHVMRGYVRGDLRPKTYAQVAARTVCVVILAFVLERLVLAAGGAEASPALLALAFLAGVVPETVLIRLEDLVRGITHTGRSRRLIGRLAPIYETNPLTQLEGIDIYDRARLMDEGVTNVEGLAHHDLVELMLKTRIPASRLVDWVDQAILYIHCPSDDEERAETGRKAGPQVRRLLRDYGIRTATDLVRAHTAACDRPDGEKEFHSIVRQRAGQPPVLQVILDSLADEDWIQNLTYWHNYDARPSVLRIPEDALDDDGQPAAPHEPAVLCSREAPGVARLARA